MQNHLNQKQFTEPNDLKFDQPTNNVEKLNQTVKKTISYMNSFLPQYLKAEEISCDVKCPVHCCLLSGGQAIKNLKNAKFIIIQNSVCVTQQTMCSKDDVSKV